jgi:hypothetical protein
VIYWRDIKLSAVVLGVCLMTLLTLSLNTFIHTLVLIQLSFLVVTLTYIVTKIAIDSFYNRDIANPFKLVVANQYIHPLNEDTSLDLDGRIDGKFDGELNLALWQSAFPPYIYMYREILYTHVSSSPGHSQLFKMESSRFS